MLAAKTNNVEAVDELLKRNANPDVVDKDGFTALTHAILSENIEIILKLFKRTKSGLKISLKKLGKSSLELNNDQNKSFFEKLKLIIKSIIDEKRSHFNTFLEAVAIFGNALWLKMLLFENPKLNKRTRERILKSVIMSDDAKSCQIIAQYDQFVLTPNLKKLAISRGKAEVIKAFNLEQEENTSIFNFFKIRREQKERNEIFKKVIKSEDFSYHDNISYVIKKWFKERKSDVWIKFADLLRELRAPEVHFHLDY